MRPVPTVVGGPERFDSAPWVGRSDQGSRLCVGPTGDILVHSALDGAGGTDLADGRVWDRRSSGGGTLVSLVIDGETSENTVGLREGEEHKRKKEGEGGEEES